MGRTEAEISLVAIAHPQQLGPVLEPPPGLLPQLCRLDRGHDQLGGPGPFHLLADDGLEL